MSKKHICKWVHWAEGEFIGRKRIYLDSDTEGHLSDGRPVVLVNGNWIYGGDHQRHVDGGYFQKGCVLCERFVGKYIMSGRKFKEVTE